ncbi:hypothetical protein NQ314_015192 [Rhamnusium bicolor]|uniref:Antitoxin n=1 Tax=Rhamnusium bicolor TaxID=1586634 RepID=A0AAV8X0C4_9CUCU|nr:hypothetical protein NQ314_015192 [Rhamnusium bicolor]
MIIKMVFSTSEEAELSDYLKRASDVYFGLSPREVRKFAYQYGVYLKKVNTYILDRVGNGGS